MDPALLLINAVKNDSTESVGFLNDMMVHMWPFINPAVAKIIKEIVEPMFAELLPGPFKATVFRKIDLGSVPLKFDAIDVIQRSKDSIKLDVDVHWDGVCDIELTSPIIGTYGVESVKISGRLAVLFQPLLPVLPVVGAVQAAFINPPCVDLDFTGIADIADVSLIRGAIRKTIGQVINSILVLPNRLLVPISPVLNYFSTVVPPTGFVRLTVERGSGFKTTGRLVKDIPDVYCNIAVGAEKSARTVTVNNCNEPVWSNQKFDFLYCEPQQMVHLHVFDDDLTGDDALGGCIFPLSHLFSKPNARAEIPLRTDEGPTGASITLSAQVRAFSADKTHFDSPDAADTKASHVGLGLMTAIVAGVKGIPDAPDLAPFVKVAISKSHTFRTPAAIKGPLVNPCAPDFNSQFRVPLTPALLGEKPVVHFELCDGHDTLGKCVVDFDEVLDCYGMNVQKNVKLENGAIMKIGVILHSCVAA